MQDRKFPEGTMPVAMCFLSVLIVLVIVATLLLRSCTQGPKPVNLTPTPQIRTESTTQTTSTASQSIKITIRRPNPTTARKTTNYNAKTGPLNKSPECLDVQHSNTALTERREGNSAKEPDLTSENTDQEEITIEMTQNMTASASGSASASVGHIVDANKMITSPFGVMLTTAPDHVALDYRVLKLGQFGADISGNLSYAGLGITCGEKVFIYGGVYTTLHEPKINLNIGLGARI